MSCTEFERYLDESVEQRQPPDAARVRAHLSNCVRSECRQLWEDQQLLASAVAAWRQVGPRVQLDETVVRAWAETDRGAGLESPLERAFGLATARPGKAAVSTGTCARPLAPREARRGTAAAVAAAIVLLMAVGSLWPSLRKTGRDVTDSGPAQKAVGTDALTGASDLSADAALQDVSVSYVSLAQNATRMVTDTVVLTIGGEEDLEEPNRAAQWIGGWQDRLDPWGQEIGAAVERILETLPNDNPAT